MVCSIIGYLASDSLKGRNNFTPELERAAVFIAGEFERYGLEPFGNSGYLQPFNGTKQSFDHVEEFYVNNTLLTEKEYLLFPANALPPTLRKADFQIIELKTDKYDEVLDSFAAGGSFAPRLLLLPPSAKGLLKELRSKQKELPDPAEVVIIMLKPEVLSQVLLRVNPALKKSLLFNVIGILPGKSRPNEVVLVTAHYDHVGIGKPVKKDSIYNGANDNASGTAAMMMLARYFAQAGSERTIVFVAFAGEEINLLGSYHLAGILKPSAIVAMLNFEMLGKPHEENRVNTCMITGTKKKDLPKFLKWKAAEKGVVLRDDDFIGHQLYERSDHYPFARKGVLAYTIMNFSPDDRTYHQPSDELETLDLANMCVVLQAFIPAIAELVNGMYTPGKK
ncbi:MAG: peptidase [Chitinophagaceae bacterium]|nr:peptidase [Chitinophagaceae bacterium]